MKDKKKLIVVVALALVIVCVGVFQFAMGGSSAAPPMVAAKTTPKPQLEQVAAPAPKNPMWANPLPARDPFESAPLPDNQPKPAPVAAAQPQPQPEPRQRPLPPAGIDTSGGFAPLKVEAAPEAKFSFTLSGVMLGERPMAVFTDAQGNQRLIMLGGSLDPESRVTSIDKDAVTVRFHGKTLRLTVEGNPNAK